MRVDYLAPTFYFLDILILVYLIARRSDLFVVLFPLLLTNLLFSQNPWSSLSWSLHFFLYLAFILSLQFRSLRMQVIGTLLFTLLFQAALGTAQVISGHSLQGIFYYLGERLLSLGQPGIASGTLFGNLVLRAYGTFSHPNVLAGYSVIALLIIIRLVEQRAARGSDLVGNPTRSDPKVKVVITSFVTIFIIFLTQSRTAALSLFGLIIPFHLIRSVRSRLIYIIILLCSLFTIQYSSSFSRPIDLAVSERLSLQKLSLNIIAAYPIFGTGAGSSITTYPAVAPNFRLLQPDHNSFTLLLSWFGLLPVILLITSLLRKQRQSSVGLTLQDSSRLDLKSSPKRSDPKGYSVWLFPLLPLFLFDHYLLTSPQGLFMLLVYLRVVNLSHAQKNSH